MRAKRSMLLGVIWAALSLWLSLSLSPSAAGAAERPTLPFRERAALNGVPYDIIIPENWNGGLVIDAHGRWDPAFGPFDLDALPVIHAYLKTAQARGYAAARSAFSIQGVNWIEGAEESVALRNHFERRFGLTGPAFITGNHGGGFICHLVMERHPTSFDGGLCMSSIAGPYLSFYFRQAFDRRLLFDYFFPGLPGSAVAPTEGQASVDLERATALMNAAPPEKVTAYLRMVGRWDVDSAVRALRSSNANLYDLIGTRLGGRNPFDNRNVIYFGSDDDAKLNREIPHHAADPQAQAYLRAWEMTGRIERPVIAMNPLRDNAVSTAERRVYLSMLQQAGREALFVQYWIDSDSVQITPGQFDTAFGKLEAWVKDGRKPAPGELPAQ